MLPIWIKSNDRVDVKKVVRKQNVGKMRVF